MKSCSKNWAKAWAWIKQLMRLLKFCLLAGSCSFLMLSLVFWITMFSYFWDSSWESCSWMRLGERALKAASVAACMLSPRHICYSIVIDRYWSLDNDLSAKKTVKSINCFCCTLVRLFKNARPSSSSRTCSSNSLCFWIICYCSIIFYSFYFSFWILKTYTRSPD